jgi:chorismate mutase
MSSSAPFDAPPAPATPAEEPPAQDDWPGGLGELRAELDRIDAALQDLLIERAQVVERVAQSGKRGAYRPGREASIIRRLLRRHSGGLPPQTLVRIWRELLAGTTAMQGPFVIAVCEPDGGAALTQAAREHFGALTPLHVCGSAAQALAEVSRGAATVAVLPAPDCAHNTWWTVLIQEHEPRMHVVGRLPFWAPRPEGAPDAQGLVVGSIEPDPSGDDRSLLGLEIGQDVSHARLAGTLRMTGLTPEVVVLGGGRGAAVALVEVGGFVTGDDPRLTRLAALDCRPVVLGAYAIPETGGAA